MHTTVYLALFAMCVAVALGCCFEGATNVSDGILGWSPDGSTLLTFGRGALGALNATSGKQIWQGQNVSNPQVAHKIRSGDEANVFYTPDGLHIVSNCWYDCGDDCAKVSFCFFNTSDGKLMQVVNTSWNRYDGLWPMALSPDGKHLAGKDYHVPLTPWDTNFRFIRIWDASTGAIVDNFKQGGTIFGGGDDIRVVTFSPDGKHVISLGDDEFCDSTGVVMGMISIWDLARKRRVKLSDTRQGQGMRTQHTISFSPNGSYFATGEFFGHFVRIWDIGAHKLVRRIVAPSTWRIIWSPDGAKIATLYSKDGPGDKQGANGYTNHAHWYIHDVVTGDCLQDIPVDIPDWQSDLPESTASWSPDGSYFAWQSTFPGPDISSPDHTGPIHITAFRSGNCTFPPDVIFV